MEKKNPVIVALASRIKRNGLNFFNEKYFFVFTSGLVGLLDRRLRRVISEGEVGQ